jgi:hypothetical protein
VRLPEQRGLPLGVGVALHSDLVRTSQSGGRVVVGRLAAKPRQPTKSHTRRPWAAQPYEGPSSSPPWNIRPTEVRSGQVECSGTCCPVPLDLDRLPSDFDGCEFVSSPQVSDSAHRRYGKSLTCTYVQFLINVQVRALRSSCRLLVLRGRGQEGLTADTGVTVTLLSHSAHHPSFRATWCFPECGSPMTIVGYAAGVLPDTQ